MMAISIVQFLLFLFAVGTECTVEILRPSGKPQIQPLSVKSIYDEDTNMTSYTLLFSGPQDITEKNDIPLFETQRTQKFSIFKVEKQVRLGKSYMMEFTSASTNEMLKVRFLGKAVSAFQQIAVPDCIFDIKKETNTQSTKYSVNDDQCQPKPEEDFDPWNFFTGTLSDNQGRLYKLSDKAMKEYVNETDTYLSFNEEAMRKDGIKLRDANYNILIIKMNGDLKTNIIPSFAWVMILK